MTLVPSFFLRPDVFLFSWRGKYIFVGRVEKDTLLKNVFRKQRLNRFFKKEYIKKEIFDKILLSLKYFSYICIVKCIGIFVFTFHFIFFLSVDLLKRNIMCGG